MNLKQYIQENPTDTLADIQAYSVTVDTKQVGSGQARGLFVNETGIGSYDGVPIWTIFSMAASDPTHPQFAIASAILITASDAGSYFGMDEDKPDGVANRAGIASLVTDEIMSQETADKFIAKTISTTYPFKHTTQEEFDEAHAALVGVGSTESVVKYDHVDSIQSFHVRDNSNKTQIEIALDAFDTVNTNFKVYVSTPSGISGSFVENEKSISTATIKVGETETVITLERFYARHTKYRIVSDRVGTSSALVTAVSKY